MAERSSFRRAFYVVIRAIARLFCLLWFQLRCHGRERQLAEGAALVCSNHQSYLDPIVVGCVFERRLNFLAKKTLFRFGPFAWFIRTLDAIPLDREGVSLSGMKETLKRLRRGELVLIFPEGTRTPDGQVHAFQSGVLALIRRGRASIVPVGLDGAYQSWPRDRAWPRRHRVHVVIGDTISREEVMRLDDDQLLEMLHRRVAACWEQAREAVQRP